MTVSSDATNAVTRADLSEVEEIGAVHQKFIVVKRESCVGAFNEDVTILDRGVDRGLFGQEEHCRICYLEEEATGAF